MGLCAPTVSAASNPHGQVLLPRPRGSFFSGGPRQLQGAGREERACHGAWLAVGLAAAPRRAHVSAVIGVRPGAVTPVLSHEQEDYFRPIRGDRVLQITLGCDCFALC